MKLYRLGTYLLPAACIAGSAIWWATPVFSIEAKGVADSATASLPKTWSELAAAKYLDGREVWWQSWAKAQMDHGTVCISCHTTVPYAMARPVLRLAMHESAAAGPEKVLLDNVEKRVNQSDEMVPFYSDAADGPGKTAESQSTEAVMNAVILTSVGGRMRQVTRKALDAAWALQFQRGEDAGGWLWQNFHLSPWESGESSYEGAAMLMLNLGTAPEIFAPTPENRRHVELLEGYLRKHYAEQPLLNQIFVYWASAKSPKLLNGSERADLLKKLQTLQQADGGWNLASMDELKRADKTAQPAASDGLATALVALALEAHAAGREDVSLERGLAWLERNQGKDGRWQAYSLNKERDPESNIGKFMSDAATGYAVLALEQAK